MNPLPLRDLLRRDSQRRLAVLDALLDHRAEVAQEALHGPRGGVAERADGAALDLLRDVEQQVDFRELGLAALELAELGGGDAEKLADLRDAIKLAQGSAR